MSPTAAAAAPTLIHVPIGDLFPSPLNPRKKFTPESLRDLADNIQKRGEVIVPMIVRSKGKRYEIIDGERRYRASHQAGNIEALPSLVRDDMTDAEAIEFMLLSSIQKQELTALEEAGGFKALIDSNKSKYSVAYIADRIGRSEKYVWDRMKLLDLIKEAKLLLDRDQILVGHGEILAKLKPEDQRRAIGVYEDDKDYFDVSDGGIWRNDTALLDLDSDAEEDAFDKQRKKDPFYGLKAVSVAELQAWVDKHVRLDVQHDSAAAPLDFGPLAARVEEAAAKPGRGKKVVAITYDNYVDPDARDEKERTFGPKAWKRADGSKKTTESYVKGKFTLVDSPACEHAVLGLVAIGRDRGQSFDVCIARDKCEVHWKNEIAEREKNAKLRQQGKGGQAAQREQKSREAEDRRRAAEEAERQLIDKLRPSAEAAFKDYIEKLSLKKVLGIVASVYAKGAKNPEQVVRVLAVKLALDNTHYMPYFEREGKRFGFDVKAWFADQKKKVAAKSEAEAPADKKAKKR